MASAQDLRIRISADGTAAIAGLRQVQGEVERTGARVNATRTQLDSAGSSLKRIGALAAAAASALAGLSLGRDFLASVQETESLARSFATITGSAQAAADELAYVRAAADQMGLTANDAGQAFLSLTAASKGSALEGQATRAAFESVAKTMGMLGKSTADINGALYGLSQMLSTDSLMLEDFNIIVGRIPGTQKLVADGLGKTVAEMRAMITDGTLLTRDVIPIMTAQFNLLAATGQPVQGLTAEWQRLRTALDEAYATLNTVTGLTAALAGGMAVLTASASAFNSALASGDLDSWVTGLQAAVGATAGITALAAAIKAAEVAQIAFDAVVRLNPYVLLATTLVGLAGALYATRDATITLGNSTVTVGATMQSAWEIATKTAQSLWQDFTDWLSGALEAMGIDFKGTVDRLVSAWQAGMENLLSLASGTINLLISLFNAGGRAIGAILGEIALSWETKTLPSFERLNNALADSFTYEDHLAKAGVNLGNVTTDLAKQLEKKAAQIDWLAQEEADYAELERGLAADQAKAKAQEEARVALKKAQTEAQAGLTAATDKGTKATKSAAAADKEATNAARERNKALEDTNRAVQGLISRYLPARQASEDYEEAQKAVAAALAGGDGSIALSAEEARQIMDGLAKDQAKAADAARRDSDAFYAAWADAVDSLDDTFKSLWRGLITGQGDILGDLKENVLEWIADLSYQLLLAPLVVPIQGSLMGIMGGGVTGTATSLLGTASNVGGIGSTFSGLSSLASGVTSLFSGATFSGISTGFSLALENIGAAGYFGSFGANMALAGSSASSGALGTALGAAAPYLLPVAGIAAAGFAIFSKWQDDQEPRYGTLAAQTLGGIGGLEDSVYASGSFGLSFGLTDKGSKNMEAEELRDTYQALADLSDALADFFGADLSAFIESELAKMSDFGDGLIHLTENEGDIGGAMAALVDRIAEAAGRSSEDIGIAFAAMVGELSGTAEEVSEQIQNVMLSAVLGVQLSDKFDDDLGQLLELTGDLRTDLGLLTGYIDTFGSSLETSADTLTRLVTQVELLNFAVEQTATDISSLTAEGVLSLSDKFVDAFASLDEAAAAQAFFYDQFTTATDKLVDTIQDAAEQIGREIPKLQDGLMALSEDVTSTITTVTNEITNGVKDLAAESATTTTVSASIFGDMGAQLAQSFGAEMGATLQALHTETVEAADMSGNIFYGMYDQLVASFGAELAGRMVNINALTGESATTEAATQAVTTTTTITTPGDPNAAILARLLDDLPETRQGFNDLIGAIDLTTEAGQKLYAGLMELAPQFDLLYDGVEAFTDWLLGVDEVTRATENLSDLFTDLGLTMPSDRDALLSLYDSGTLTTEQMALLAAYLDDLSTVYGDLTEDTEDLTDAADELADSLSRIQSSLERYRTTESATLNDLNRALAELSAWNAWGMVPSADDLDRTLGVLDAIDPKNFATQQAYEVAQGQIYANLLALEQRALGGDVEVTDADTLDAYLAADRTASAVESNVAQSEAQVILLSEVKASLDALRQDLAVTATSQVVPLRAIENRLIQWESDGLPATRAA